MLSLDPGEVNVQSKKLYSLQMHLHAKVDL